MPASSDSLMMNFIKSLNDSLTEDNLPDQFWRYLQHNFPDHSFALLEHTYSPWPYRILTPGDFAEQTLVLLSSLNSEDYAAGRKQSFCQIENLHLFPFKNSRQGVVFILLAALTKPASRKIIIDLCGQVQNFFKSLSSTACGSVVKIQQQYGMYINNLAHDFNSLIDLLSALDIENESVRQKLNYGKKLSRDFHFYLAEMELLKTSLAVNELLSAVLQNYSGSIEIKSTPAATGSGVVRFSVDPVLINRAIQAVLDNALYYAGLVKGKVQIELDRIKNRSLFIPHDWVKLSILNTGPVIPAEYLTLVTKPLFTTLKEQGHVGLGLAIAKKIIQAHGGCLLVSNHDRDGVQVTICLPVEDAYAEK